MTQGPEDGRAPAPDWQGRRDQAADPGTRCPPRPPRDHASWARRPTDAPPRVVDQYRRATAVEEGQPATGRARHAASRAAVHAPSDGPQTRRWWPIVVTLVPLAVIISLLTPSGRHQWALSLFRQPTRYTALSFDNAAALPRTATIGQPIRVSFTVSNQEGQAEHYRYVLSDSDPGISNTLGRSSKVVAPGSTWRVSTVVRPTCAESPCRIEVSLPGHPETIDFILILTPGQG
jgi:hypothetical protein